MIHGQTKIKLTDWFYNRDGECLLRGKAWIYVYKTHNHFKVQWSLYVPPV